MDGDISSKNRESDGIEKIFDLRANLKVLFSCIKSLNMQKQIFYQNFEI